MGKQTNQLKIGSVLSYAQMFLSIVIGLVYTPVMIRLLGQSEYGLYNTVASTISMLSILTLGFNSSYVRYFSKYKSKNDYENIYRLNGLFIIVFTIMGIIALVCGLFLSFNLNLVFAEGLTQAEYSTARVLMILLTVNLSISFPASVFSSIISANEKFIFLKLLGMLKTVLGPLVTLPLLLFGYRSIAMVAVTLLVSTITDIVYFIYVRFVMNNRFVFHGFEKGLFRSLFAFTFFLALNMIVDQINSNMGKFLLGRYNGTVSVAIYSVGFSLYQYYMMFSTSVSSVFTPKIHAIVNETIGDMNARKQRLTDVFIRVGRIQFLILGLIATGLIFFGQPFIEKWAGNGYEDSYFVMLLLVLPSSIPLIQNCGIEIQRALNKHQFRSIVYIFMALINVISTIILCQQYGAIGAGIGTALSLLIANGLIMNIYYHRACYVDILCFWKNIFQVTKGMILPIIAGILIMRFIDLSSVVKLLVFIILYAGIYCGSMWLFGMNDYEKNLFKLLLRKLLRRKA